MNQWLETTVAEALWPWTSFLASFDNLKILTGNFTSSPLWPNLAARISSFSPIKLKQPSQKLVLFIVLISWVQKYFLIAEFELWLQPFLSSAQFAMHESSSKRADPSGLCPKQPLRDGWWSESRHPIMPGVISEHSSRSNSWVPLVWFPKYKIKKKIKRLSCTTCLPLLSSWWLWSFQAGRCPRYLFTHPACHSEPVVSARMECHWRLGIA